jgi:hypothetical protein
LPSLEIFLKKAKGGVLPSLEIFLKKAKGGVLPSFEKRQRQRVKKINQFFFSDWPSEKLPEISSEKKFVQVDGRFIQSAKFLFSQVSFSDSRGSGGGVSFAGTRSQKSLPTLKTKVR